MRMIISPAKKMNTDTDSFACHGLPQLLPKTEQLLSRLRAMSLVELKSLWKCNDRLVQLNAERVRVMDLHHCLTPALMAYEGIQYQYMAPGVFSQEQLDYVEEHLRILSGFYGILRPFDGVTPYRLEMQARLSVSEAKSLYEYWGTSLSDSLFSETDCVINLASKEYSVCVSRYVPEGARFVTCVFGEQKGEKIVEKGTRCKMARGEMVRYMAERKITKPEQMQAFDRLGYRFSPEKSDRDHYVFVQ